MNQLEQARILIVDDTPQNLRLLAEILSVQGYEIRPAISGKVALRSLAADAPDLILMDVTMPEMDGYEVCRQIKQNEDLSSIPIIFISALDDVADKVKGFQAGGVDFITKPFQEEEVLARVRTHLSLWFLQRQLAENNTQLSAEIAERKRIESELREVNLDLIRINKDLESAYAELARTQQQMLQQEKMASVGQLAAGVAHEINNPLGFIISNLATLKSYMGMYARLYELLKCDIGFGTQVESVLPASVRDYLKRTDFSFINADAEELLNDTREGLDRVSKIVKSLRRFARIDSLGEYEAYDLNEEIENVLTITRNELKDIADIYCDYGDLPELRGDGSQINQVLINLILNAGTAIKRKNAAKGTIAIRTWAEPNAVKLSIRDDGEGIEPGRLSDVFNPFFTTKPVGDGTGLGLSISYDIIVNRHAGTMEVQSELGHWTEFVISMPVVRAGRLETVNNDINLESW